MDRLKVHETIYVSEMQEVFRSIIIHTWDENYILSTRYIGEFFIQTLSVGNLDFVINQKRNLGAKIIF